MNHRALVTVLFPLALTSLPACTDRGGAESPHPSPSAQQKREFIPSAHGFVFTNSFRGNPFPDSVRNSPLASLASNYADDVGLDVPTRFGLCGGMCAAAADYWNLGRTPPVRPAPPREGDPLYDYLRQRNADSLGVAGVMALKFIEWMGMPEEVAGPCTASLTAAELDGVIERVRSKGYAHLGLVYVDSKTGKPWQNHQVLARGVGECTDSRLVLWLYDPNDPGDDSARLEISRERDTAGRELARVVEVTAKERQHVRGFFPMPYEPKVPSENLEHESAPTDRPGRS